MEKKIDISQLLIIKVGYRKIVVIKTNSLHYNFIYGLHSLQVHICILRIIFIDL